MSSQQQQHVINMTGLDSGPVTTGISGGGGSASQLHQQTTTLSSSTGHGSSSGGGGGSSGSSSGFLPGAFRPSSTQRSPRLQSIYAPLSPSQNHAQNYSTNRMTTLSPLSGSATSPYQLGRSQSLGHAAYQQMQAQGFAPSSSSSMYSQQPIEASPYRSRDANQPSYSEGNTGGALLPTINTHNPQTPMMNSSYSPNVRHSMALDTPTYNVASGPPKSPITRQQGSGSPYVPTSTHNNRPVSMYDASFGLHQPPQSSSRNSYHPMDSSMSPVQRASPSGMQVRNTSSNQHLRAADGSSGGGGSGSVAMNSASPLVGDSLPLYSNPSIPSGQIPSSPYGPSSSSQYVGAPPRINIAGGGTYTTGIDSVDPGPSINHRERRGTLTNAGVGGAGDFAKWDRQKRMAAAAAAEIQQNLPQAPRVQEGFRRVRDMSDLKAVNEPAIAGTGRRADPSGGYVSPLKAMTAYLHHTYHLVNPAFFYELSFNPRRVLTKPSKPMHNEGHDNEDSDYILYVNDWLGAEEGNRYLILDVLGQGTFGQVVKCQNMKTREIVAVKVIKNKPAYFNQSMMEVTILEMLNGNWDPHDQHHILRLRDTFIHAKHLCLVFELLSSNLYELIKQNSFRGLSTSLVRVFTTQLLDALTVLHEARLIHCDLKPENILLKTLQTPSIKLVDFGSACHERQTVYTYIQSRFYRSPEVLLGLPYNASIDMWSLGCIAVELFLGLPLFPGTSEYNQVCRIVEMLGLPPSYMLESGKQTGEFFTVYTDEYNRRNYKLKGREQYSKEHNVEELPSKRYFQATTLPDIIKTYPLARKSGKPADVQKEMSNRNSFVDFVTGLLHMDPTKRWTPQQAKLHPFITGEKLTQPFQPPLSPVDSMGRGKTNAVIASSASSTDVAKHPYGGLPQTPSRSSGKVYHDAAAYNQHLAQQQAYNSAHQARQNQPPIINNPYVQDEMVRNERAQAEANAHAKAAAKTQAQVQQAQAQAHAQAQAQAQAQAYNSAQAQAHAAQVQAAAMSPPYGQNSASTSPFVSTRSRSNTMTRMDLVPGQLAKMGIEGGHGMTPVLNRDESMREWERRHQNGGGQMNQAAMQSSSSSNRQGKQQRSDYQHLDMLQQQAEAIPSTYSTPANQQWSQLPNSNSYSTLNRMATSTTSPPINNILQSPQSYGVVSLEAQQQQLGMGGGSHESIHQQLASPNRGTAAVPPTSSYSSPNSSNIRYQSAVVSNSSNPSSLAAFDPYNSDIAQLMPALQPTQYQSGGSSSNPNTSNNARRQSMMPSINTNNMYGSSVGGNGGPTSPRGQDEGYHQQQQQNQQATSYHSQQPTAHQGGRMRYG